MPFTKTVGKVVALKVFARRYSDDTAQTEQFYREGLMGVSLRHPNIVPIYEAVSKGNQHYLVMEFVEGGNLRDFVKVRKKFPPSKPPRSPSTSPPGWTTPIGAAYRTAT